MTSSRTYALGLSFSLLALATLGCGRAADETSGQVSSSRVAAGDASSLPRIGPAPSWQLTRLDGTTLRSEELRGKVVVVDFWATWCGPCIQEVPGYVEMQQRYGEQGLVIVGISLDQQGPPVVQRFVERYGINYPIVMGDESITEAFGGVQGIPTTFLIDREGQIRHRKVGAMKQAEYEPLVSSLL